MAVITEWPAMALVRADEVKAGNKVYGHWSHRSGNLILWDEPLTVTSIDDAYTIGHLRIEGHERDGVWGFTIQRPAGRLIVGKDSE